MNTMSAKTPVAVFSYNRPAHTNRALEALSKCRDLDACDFYFYSDGPRSDAVHADVDATRSILHQWAEFFSARVIEQATNLGLAKSIVAGVSDLCERYGRVIVVEDDLIVNPDFLHFMIQSLDHYKEEPHVMQVSGFTIRPPDSLTADAFLLPVTTTWGWGTWQRAWQSFAWTPKDLEIAKMDHQWRDLFDLNGAGSFSSMLEDRLAGRNDSWGILWWYAVSRSKGLVVYPSQSLVWNGGFDGSGVHCGSDDFLLQGDASSYTKVMLPSMLLFPSPVEYDPSHLMQLEEHLRKPALSGRSSPCLVCHPSSKLIVLVRRIKEKIQHVFFG